MLKLTGRYFHTMPLDNMHYRQEAIDLDPSRTALVAMHCWNIGCEDGPALDKHYRVGMGGIEALKEADGIMRQCIRPAMDACRRAGVLVCHVECDSIAAKHPEAQRDADPPPPARPASEVVPGWRKRMAERAHGKDYMTKSPYARMDRANICMPQGDEPLLYQTNQLDRYLRRKSIENLVYCGFATDMCVLRAPGGVEPMAGFSYRMYLLRDATIGVEHADTFVHRIATRWAVRYFEAQYGHTFTTETFIKACAAQ